MSKCQQLSALATATVGLTLVANTAVAATFDLTFTYNAGLSSSSSGTGSVTINDAVIVPNFTGTIAVSNVTAFSSNFINLSAIPSSTSFGLANLNQVGLVTNSNGDVTALSFGSIVNSNNYILNILGPNLMGVSGNSQNTSYNLTFDQVPTSVPEPGSILGLLLIGSTGLLARVRKTKNN